MTDDLKRIDKFSFRALPVKGQRRVVAKLVRRLYLNPLDKDAYFHYERFREADPMLPSLPDKREALSHLYHALLEEVGNDPELPKILPEVRRLDHVDSITPFLPYHIYLDHLRSGYNVGSILRTTEAFRLGTVHLSPHCPGKQHKEVKKTALGAEEIVPLTEHTSIATLPRPWIAFETAPEAHDYRTFNFPKEGTFIFGNEEFGISNELLSQADFLVEIPLYGIKNSLNVANAFAIIASQIAYSLHNRYP